MPTDTAERVKPVRTLEDGRLLLSQLQEQAEECAHDLLGSGAGCVFWPTVANVALALAERLAEADEIIPTGHLENRKS